MGKVGNPGRFAPRALTVDRCRFAGQHWPRDDGHKRTEPREDSYYTRDP